MKFWDREKEISDMMNFLNTEPNSILFVYGPKSSGKSTFLIKVAQMLKESPFQFLWYDLRKYAIEKTEDAISILLGAKGVSTALAKLFDIQLGVISIKPEELLKVFKKEKDPFLLLEEGLLKIRDSGDLPVIVFDELQNLKDIYLNGDRKLVDRIFNFFVTTTKVNHLSHVIVMSSDTFFIEEVYSDSTLKNCSRYYLVDYFDDEVAYKVLVNEGVEEEEAKEIVERAGGVPWILEEVLESDEPIKTIDELFSEFLSKIYEATRNRKDLKELLKRAIEGENLYYADEEINGVKELAEKEVFFYDPIKRMVRFQTRLDELAAREILKINWKEKQGGKEYEV